MLRSARAKREAKLEGVKQKARLRFATRFGARRQPRGAPDRACARLTRACAPATQLRETCLARVRDSRASVLASLRARAAAGGGAPGADAAAVGAHLRQLVADELQRGLSADGAGARPRAPAGRAGCGVASARR